MKHAGLALMLTALAAAPAVAGGARHGAVYLVSEGPPGHHGTRYHRTALEDGYFAHGSLGWGGRFEYDRGYPFDHFPEAREPEESHWEPQPSGRGCESKWVRDGNSKRKAEVRVCR